MEKEPAGCYIQKIQVNHNQHQYHSQSDRKPSHLCKGKCHGQISSHVSSQDTYFSEHTSKNTNFNPNTSLCLILIAIYVF